MFDQHKNFAYSVITTAPTPASTGGSLGVVAGQGALFPAVPFNAVAWPPNVNPTIFNAEVVRVTDITTDTFTIVRHQEGTSAQNIAVGWQIMAAITSKTLTDIENLLSGVTSGAILNAPSILTPGMTTPVITGGGSWAGNPSFSGAPSIASLANSQHDHHNAANGGMLPATAMPALDFASQALSNPYKFSAYRNAAQTPGNNGIIQYDTEEFDTNNNFDVTTNKGRYTVPLTGFYQINVLCVISVTAAPQDPQISLLKNGVGVVAQQHMVNMYNGGSNESLSMSVLLSLAANDYLEVIIGTSYALVVGSAVQRFSGFLVSKT